MKPKIFGFTQTQLKKGLRYSFTEVKLKKDGLYISHAGNMGHGISTVDKNLGKLGLPTIQTFKNEYTLITEVGSPDYSYYIKFKFS